ncbi:MAG: dihydrolipoamide acetyltransferase family protein [Chloroflexota bacterium]
MNREITMPQLGFTMVEGTITEWRKREGEPVAKGEALLEVTTEKVSIEVESPVSGVVQQILAPAGSTVPVATPICLVATEAEATDALPVVETVAEVVEPRIRASGLAKRLARERGIDLAALKGSGPGGRILESDVIGYLAHLSPQSLPIAPRTGQRVPFAGTRRVIGERMFQSVRSTAQVTLVAEVDATEATRLRAQLLPEWEKRDGVRLTFTDLVVKACGKALREHPKLNATLDGEEILLCQEVNVGIAVALPDGLIVPVLRQVDAKPLRAIAAESRDLVERARNNRLSVDEVSGGTFTLTNLGSYGIDLFTPIINTPETAILGVGRVAERPAVFNNEICQRSLMYLSLTFDHRLVDGAPAAEFMQRLRELMEQPYLLLT